MSERLNIFQAEQMFPTLSLSQVLEEVRKATSLYGVMTEVAGKPTLILDSIVLSTIKSLIF